MKPVQFSDRHIGPNSTEIQEMLNAVGVNSIEQLIERTIPDSIRLEKELDLRPDLSQYE